MEIGLKQFDKFIKKKKKEIKDGLEIRSKR